MQVSTCVSFEHQLAVTCGNFERAQISSQVEETCNKLARACDSFEWYSEPHASLLQTQATASYSK
jgi:hypothetical protein